MPGPACLGIGLRSGSRTQTEFLQTATSPRSGRQDHALQDIGGGQGDLHPTGVREQGRLDLRGVARHGTGALAGRVVLPEGLLSGAPFSGFLVDVFEACPLHRRPGLLKGLLFGPQGRDER